MIKIQSTIFSFKLRYVYLALVLSLLLLNYVTNHVLQLNQINGVYAVHSDSISMPIFVMLATTTMILFFDLIGIALASTKWLRWLGIGMTLISVLIVLESSLDWLSPNHRWIAISHVPTFLICTLISILSFSLRK